jgi:ABC-type transport system substrate-binding protein
VSERAAAGKFDAIMLAWNTDPTPTSGIPQVWTRAGIGRSNYLRYDNPAFDALVDRASAAATREQARTAWRAAIETVSADAPGIFLFANDNVAAFHNRVTDVRIRPDSWAALLRTWRIPPDRLIDRDRVER